MKFNPETVAQMSAFFAMKDGGEIFVLKLMKLLYLADRLSIKKYAEPISWDQMVSMDQGPVLSKTLDYIGGNYPPDQSTNWDKWMQDRNGHKIASNNTQFTRADLDRLSDADIEILEEIWNEFGHMNRWELRDYTHKHCPEWTDPKGSSIPFQYEDVLRGVGGDSKSIRDLYHNRRAQQELDRILS